jgi:predicted nucleotidyltransferase
VQPQLWSRWLLRGRWFESNFWREVYEGLRVIAALSFCPVFCWLSNTGTDMDLEDAARVVAKWAADKPAICRVHLFGSRVRGTHRGADHPGGPSDLDVAVELIKHREWKDWIWDSEGWPQELSAMLGLEVDLQQDRGESTPRIGAALRESSLLVYQRCR